MRYFKPEEFRCKCGCKEIHISDVLVALLDLARDKAGVPFIITSGYRCIQHNKNINGNRNSSHTKGLAADIAINPKNKNLILGSVKKYFKRIGIADKFVHVDIDSDKPNATWYYK